MARKYEDAVLLFPVDRGGRRAAANTRPGEAGSPAWSGCSRRRSRGTGGRTERLRAATGKLKSHPLIADVLIYQEAVRYALQYNEFFNANEIPKAKVLLREGEERARQLSEGQSPWATPRA